MTTAMTAAKQRQLTMKNNLRSILERGKEEFASVLPSHMTPDRMVRIAITACTTQPKLLECTPESVGLALLTASQTGLEPDGYHAHLIPYGKVCQFIPDYKGLIQLALKNDVVIDAYVVYVNDDFEYTLGSSPHIKHVPNIDGERGEMRCAYAVAKFSNGLSKFVVATKAEIEKRKRKSRSSGGSDSPWNQWPEEMWTKTAVKMLMKFVPRSPEMKAAVVADDLVEMGVQQSPIGIASAGRIAHTSPTERTDSVLDRMLDSESSLRDSMLEKIRNCKTGDEVDVVIEQVRRVSAELSEDDANVIAEEADLQKAVIKGEVK